MLPKTKPTTATKPSLAMGATLGVERPVQPPGRPLAHLAVEHGVGDLAQQTQVQQAQAGPMLSGERAGHLVDRRPPWIIPRRRVESRKKPGRSGAEAWQGGSGSQFVLCGARPGAASARCGGQGRGKRPADDRPQGEILIPGLESPHYAAKLPSEGRASSLYAGSRPAHTPLPATGPGENASSRAPRPVGGQVASC
jgi:hypothetical protein